MHVLSTLSSFHVKTDGPGFKVYQQHKSIHWTSNETKCQLNLKIPQCRQATGPAPVFSPYKHNDGWSRQCGFTVKWKEKEKGPQLYGTWLRASAVSPVGRTNGSRWMPSIPQGGGLELGVSLQSLCHMGRLAQEQSQLGESRVGPCASWWTTGSSDHQTSTIGGPVW